ncbi:uncharacterized protein LOC121882877 isoform X2 [Thunnus maccoyii]|uniref:uncharacterized protein LOC121882877 isoform X2 n=1 Tax=Thunnus maccoyii TaxID=8240 RepID=UPI001C4CF399|nr:uncharacterized protein LOC121882877 isoform X2 [Thunnus maccoyii]
MTVGRVTPGFALMTLIFLFRNLSSAETGESRAICPSQPIEVAQGDDVTLQCHLDPSVDVSAYTADWKRVDLNKVVYSYRNKRDHHDAQMERYRGRTTFIYEDLSRGILTLQLSSLQLSDSGPYRCFVPKLMASCVINISVVPKDQQNRTNGDESSPTRFPLAEVTEPDDPVGENMKTTTVAIVLSVVVAALVFTVVVGVLVKRGTIRKWMRSLRRRRKQKEKANGSELKDLGSPSKEDDKDPDGPTANGLISNEH